MAKVFFLFSKQIFTNVIGNGTKSQYFFFKVTHFFFLCWLLEPSSVTVVGLRYKKALILYLLYGDRHGHCFF